MILNSIRASAVFFFCNESDSEAVKLFLLYKCGNMEYTHIA